MDRTPILKLPRIRASQAQKEISMNEALAILEVVAQLSVSEVTSTPPTYMEEGDRYIVGDAPTGEWDGYDHHIAVVIGGSWRFLEPDLGWIAFDKSALKHVTFIGNWVDLVG